MKRYSLPVLLVLFTMYPSVDGNAAVVAVRGGLSTGVDIYDRSDKGSSTALGEEGEAVSALIVEEDDEDDYQRIFVRPSIAIDRSTERSSLVFSYQPTLYYDFDNEDEDVNHGASLSFRNQMSEAWTLSVIDSVLQSDIAEDVAVTEPIAATPESGATAPPTTAGLSESDRISDEEGRRKYTTNTLQVLSDYTYGQGSLFSMGYAYNILRNDDAGDDDYQDFDRHQVSLSLAHRWNRLWRSSLSGQYVRGLFDEPDRDIAETAAEIQTVDVPEEPSEDLDEYGAGMGVSYEGIVHQPLSLAYGLSASDYDDETQNDSEIHDLTFGWRWHRSPHVTYNAGAGPSYARIDRQDDTWGYNGEIGADYAIERGRFHIAVEKGMERQNFSGEVDENGLIDYWDGRADFSYQLFESTSVAVFAGYRYEDQDEVVPGSAALPPPPDAAQMLENDLVETVNSQRLYAGCSVSYSFRQKYNLNLSYRYTDQTSDDPGDEYEAHQIMLTLSYATDFWRW
ncbi:outer membrane beta-barrel protein [Desulfoprunum benzoelyticum]|uniref:Outer membrane protein beta-barrel domain-containing protein n=1 Tax=Desulfoprunum benzoelyticum TaxID=1506996 RepID=A0A840UU91_9BACT|nr:outer membrane beta-barrel protein [Desulfoprunum benzoelyticum]MBB5346964.1 hypothetical protein [Desulfoprunum benzoelyticum]MBM9531018.1 outer membrane beta-barrel protein [Desulfoprunum benzoelyticum]